VIELSDQAMTWVMTGDSTTEAVLHTHGERGWVEHVHERIRWQLDRLTDIVINSGISASRAPDVLAAYDQMPRYGQAVREIAAGHLEMANHALRTMGLGELTSL